MTSKVELAELADLARLIYCGYRESVDAYRCDRDALQAIRETPALAEYEAGQLQTLIGRGNVQGKYAQSLGDLGNAVLKQLPELWPSLRFVGPGTRWHDDPYFDWPAGIAELRRIEAAARAAEGPPTGTPTEAGSPKENKKPRIEAFVGEDHKEVWEIAQSDKTVDEKMRGICGLDKTYLYRDSPWWSDALGVSGGAIRGSDFWKKDRPAATEALRELEGE